MCGESEWGWVGTPIPFFSPVSRDLGILFTGIEVFFCVYNRFFGPLLIFHPDPFLDHPLNSSNPYDKVSGILIRDLSGGE